MAPLILHNVPDEECYVGDDGVRRPYAMYFPQQDHPTGSTRSRRAAAETGSFGKSRRSRSRTATPARGGRENATLAVADKIFGDWVNNNQAAAAAAASQTQQDEEKSSQQQVQEQQKRRTHPVEIMLRGFRSTQHQYAVIERYESLAGAILEDYPRQPPPEQTRWSSTLRDASFTRDRQLTQEERALVNRADGGDHWVKVTFESAEAADTAIYASPQRVQGYLVYAESYRGVPPTKDEAYPDTSMLDADHERSKSVPAAFGTPKRNNSSGLPSTFRSRLLDLNDSPSGSSHTIETATLSTSNSHTSAGTLPGPDTPALVPKSSEPIEVQDPVFCRRIPTARRATILPAEQALLPQQSVAQRLLSIIPFLSWFGGSIIGNEVPRTETGEFNWQAASLYWKIMWWLDKVFLLLGGDLYHIDKDE